MLFVSSDTVHSLTRESADWKDQWNCTTLTAGLKIDFFDHGHTWLNKIHTTKSNTPKRKALKEGKRTTWKYLYLFGRYIQMQVTDPVDIACVLSVLRCSPISAQLNSNLSQHFWNSYRYCILNVLILYQQNTSVTKI